MHLYAMACNCYISPFWHVLQLPCNPYAQNINMENALTTLSNTRAIPCIIHYKYKIKLKLEGSKGTESL